MKETIKAFLDEFLAIGTFEGYGVEKKIFTKLFTLGDDFVFWNPRSDIRMWQKSIDDDELDWGGGVIFMIICKYMVVIYLQGDIDFFLSIAQRQKNCLN